MTKRKVTAVSSGKKKKKKKEKTTTKKRSVASGKKPRVNRPSSTTTALAPSFFSSSSSSSNPFRTSDPDRVSGLDIRRHLEMENAKKRFAGSQFLPKVNRLSVEASFPWTEDAVANTIFQSMHAHMGLNPKQRLIADVELMRLNEASHDVRNDRMSPEEVEYALYQRELLRSGGGKLGTGRGTSKKLRNNRHDVAEDVD